MSLEKGEQVAIVVSSHDDNDGNNNDDTFVNSNDEFGLSVDERSPSRGSMTIYLLGRTYRWCSRARVAAWFRRAFNIREELFIENAEDNNNDDEENNEDNNEKLGNKNNSKNGSNSSIGGKSPKKFYELKPRSQHERTLTLEPHYAKMFPRERSSASNLERDVPRMMRAASGCWREEFTSQLHSKMIADAVRGVVRSNSDSGIANHDLINHP